MSRIKAGILTGLIYVLGHAAVVLFFIVMHEVLQ